ncbi:amidase [Ramlibacter sp. G-1-2-2]|uniref:Amidase n=1 Tax=Ramlibacter agri TaxID=2728837 RepID=A0A848HBG1_9BURK|nr:amidase [Ramlibacter agri]NML47392.1 amidase [Ramlibacter agri]
MTAGRIAPVDLHACSLAALAGMIRDGAASSVAATQWQLERAARLDPQLHCFAQLDAEGALLQAEAADARRARGERLGPLHGVPLAVKENIAVRGLPLGVGIPAWRRSPCREDAAVTQRLRAAGAVLLGTLAMSEGGWAQHHAGEAAPSNPWNPAYATSGSSSGPAVAVAAGLCHAALGTDTGGSVRQPAAACGVYGLKPTWGSFPLDGVAPMAQSLDHVGLLARSAGDLDLLLSALGAPAARPEPLRVAAPAGMLDAWDLSASARTALARAIAAFQSSGVPVQVIDELSLAELEAATAAWLPLCAPAAWEAFRPRLDDLRAGPALQALLDAGRETSQARQEAASAARARWQARIDAVFAHTDVLLLPVLRHGPMQVQALRARGSDPSLVLPAMVFTAPFNLSGHPALAVPAGTNRDGAPVAIQLVGRTGAERQLVRLARVLETLENPAS